MILKRLAVLQFVLFGGLSTVFVLPKDIKLQPAAIGLSLPDYVGDWSGQNQAISQGEREILGPDTQFARKVYSLGTEEIYVSIVLSGPDMNTSIHRPERCLPAQGWTVADSKSVSVPLQPGTLNATRLLNIRNVPLGDGRSFTIRSLDYYWFVGHRNLTPSHYVRAWIDLRDRVLKGQNQQWAYVTVTSPITKDFKIFGRNEAETEAMLRSFISKLVPLIHKAHIAAD